MKLSVQHTLLSGGTLAERFARAAEYGFDGVELAAWGFSSPIPEHTAEIEEAQRASGLAVSSLCSTASNDFVHPDRAEREKRLAGLVDLLELADRLAAAGVIAVPVRGSVSLPDLSPVADERALTDQLVAAQLKIALERSSGRAAVFLEPLNRYEVRYLRRVSHAAELCRAAGTSRVQIMADFFHMNIEESRIGPSLQEVLEHVGHVHLADSNRLLPGHGHLDFLTPLRVLKKAGYRGWFALECGVPGDATETLPAAVRFIRECWEQA